MHLTVVRVLRDCAPAGGTITCPGAVTFSAAGSNVRVAVASVSLQGIASLAGCAAAPSGSIFTLDPTSPSTATQTCDVTSRALVQGDFEDGAAAGEFTWSLTAASVDAGGDNTTYDGNHTVTFTHTLVRQPKYRLGVKRVQYNGDDPASAVRAAGEAWHPDLAVHAEWRGLLVCMHLTARLQCGQEKHTQPRHTRIYSESPLPLDCYTLQALQYGCRRRWSIPVTLTSRVSSSLSQTSHPGTASQKAAALRTQQCQPVVLHSQLATQSPHGHKLLCLGTYTFTQEELDIDQSSKVFTPAVATTTTPTVGVETTGFDAGYGVSATVSISSVPALLVSVNAGACSIPSIIPPGAQSECCRRTALHV